MSRTIPPNTFVTITNSICEMSVASFTSPHLPVPEVADDDNSYAVILERDTEHKVYMKIGDEKFWLTTDQAMALASKMIEITSAEYLTEQALRIARVEQHYADQDERDGIANAE